MSWLDDLAGPGHPVEFEHGTTVHRLRPKPVWDPVSETYVLGDWDDPDVLTLDGAFIAQSSTSTIGDATRTGALEDKSLYCAPDADVQFGDRVREGATGPTFPVDGIPAADTNPFTGWRPIREVPLQRAAG